MLDSASGVFYRPGLHGDLADLSDNRLDEGRDLLVLTDWHEFPGL